MQNSSHAKGKETVYSEPNRSDCGQEHRYSVSRVTFSTVDIATWFFIVTEPETVTKKCTHQTGTLVRRVTEIRNISAMGLRCCLMTS